MVQNIILTKCICLVFSLYLMYPFFRYILDSPLLWQVGYLLFPIIFILFAIKDEKIISYIFVIFYTIFMFAMNTVEAEPVLNSGYLGLMQVLVAVSFGYACVQLAKSEASAQIFLNYFRIVLYLVLLYIPIQGILRVYFPDYSFSEHQLFRVYFGLYPAPTSFFDEARRLGQFLVVGLFVSLNFFDGKEKYILSTIISTVMVLTFSLGALIGLIAVVLASKYISTSKKDNFYWMLLGLIIVSAAVLIGPIRETILWRLGSLFNLIGEISFSDLLENAYLLNLAASDITSREMDYYYGFRRGSEVLSLGSEFSYLWFILSEGDWFGRTPNVAERFVELNMFVDLFARFGILIVLFFVSIWCHAVKYKNGLVLIFIVLLLGFIDGGAIKPQFWFLVAIVISCFTIYQPKKYPLDSNFNHNTH